MGICKGNRGNLMQHWTFAEVLNCLLDEVQNLHLITTHSMAPWTIPEKLDHENRCRQAFRIAGHRMKKVQNPSIYESAWESLTVDSGLPYPSTAAFATRLWPAKRISVALCEFDSKTADEIDGWLSCEEITSHFSSQVLYRGDWRKSIQSPLIWNQKADCLCIEIDPMRYDARRNDLRQSTMPANLYPEDLELLIQEMELNTDKVVIQISTFSTQNNMALETQRTSMCEILANGGFELLGETRVGLQMASFLFARRVDLNCNNLRERFTGWLEGLN